MTHPNRGGHTQKTEKPDFRIRMNRDGSEKIFTCIKSYISYNLSFINFFVRPLLLGAPLLIEVGGDQEPPGNTSRYPTASKKKLLTIYHI